MQRMIKEANPVEVAKDLHSLMAMREELENETPIEPLLTLKPLCYNKNEHLKSHLFKKKKAGLSPDYSRLTM